MEIYKNLPGLAIPFIFYAVRAFVIHPSTLFSVLFAFSLLFFVFLEMVFRLEKSEDRQKTVISVLGMY